MGNKRYHIVLASVLFAVLTWLSVNMRGEFTAVRHFPVVIENLKEGKALKYPVPRTVMVRFNGSGWLIAGLYLSPGLRYFIDATSLNAETFTITKKDLLEHMKLPFAVQPVDIKPETLLLALDDYVEKRVPVVPRMVVSFHQGYGQVGPVRVTPESVIVGGAKLILERLTAWHTEYEKFSSLQSSVDVTLALEEPETFSFNVPPQPVRVRINVQPYAEKVFPGIPVTATATPPYREVIFIPPRMDLVVRGGIEQLTKLSSNDFSASVNYENLAQDSSEEVAPVLGCPPEVIVIGRKPERFQYIIRRKLQ